MRKWEEKGQGNRTGRASCSRRRSCTACSGSGPSASTGTRGARPSCAHVHGARARSPARRSQLAHTHTHTTPHTTDVFSHTRRPSSFATQMFVCVLLDDMREGEKVKALALVSHRNVLLRQVARDVAAVPKAAEDVARGLRLEQQPLEILAVACTRTITLLDSYRPSLLSSYSYTQCSTSYIVLYKLRST